MKTRLVLGILLASVVQAGCAVSRLNQAQLDKVNGYAREVLRDCPQYVVIPIGSKGAAADAAVLRTKAMTGRPSVPAEQLAKSFDLARTQPRCLAITGVSSRFAAAITAEALSLSTERDLPGLQLLFVGDEADKPTVQRAVEARGGTFHFRPQ